MSRRKLRATNLWQGYNRQLAWHHGHHFCPKCHTHGLRPHEEGCDGKLIIIPENAQVPRRTASKRVWKFFIRKFVDREFYKERCKQIDQRVFDEFKN